VVVIFCERHVVGLNRVIELPQQILTVGFAVDGIDEGWVEVDHFLEVYNRFLVDALLLIHFCSRVNRHWVVFRVVEFILKGMLKFVELVGAKESVISGPLLSLNRLRAPHVIEVLDNGPYRHSAFIY